MECYLVELHQPKSELQRFKFAVNPYWCYTLLVTGFFNTNLIITKMKIRIKTTLIKIEIEDEPRIGTDNYTKKF